MTYLTVSDAYTECGCLAGKHAVCNRYIFAGARRLKSLSGATEGDAIVTRFDMAVGHGDELTAIDIDPVGVTEIAGVKDLDSAHAYVYTAVKEERPAGRIDHGYILDRYIPALDKADDLTRAEKLFVP